MEIKNWHKRLMEALWELEISESDFFNALLEKKKS